MNDGKETSEETPVAPDYRMAPDHWVTPDYVVVETALEVTAYALVDR
ncbi:pyrroloquinoline quinone precursor peptide PqqA [Streptomyces melanogenes]|uniref:Coenzyme PQQ synthesis protein A n=1 Tax=Streptomyces melanogenes TaxID=67326 RepID=A0ABZ1XRN3_9ACTN|nr:pyrroloquinoline quinone precursor peptide PqqA [Streptomyces melanogenes]